MELDGVSFGCCELSRNKKHFGYIFGNPVLLKNGKAAMEFCVPERKETNWAIVDLRSAKKERLEAPHFDPYWAAPSFHDSYMAFWSLQADKKPQCDEYEFPVFGYVLDLRKKRIVAGGLVGCSGMATDYPFLEPVVWQGNSVLFSSPDVKNDLTLKLK